jgi:glycosyltransferase involved in cell wall biosynthesis
MADETSPRKVLGFLRERVLSGMFTRPDFDAAVPRSGKAGIARVSTQVETREAPSLGIPNSAFITVGEPDRAVSDALAGRTPSAEYVQLRQGYFSKVIAMVDTGLDPASMAAGAAFAASAYAWSWDDENIYLGEEFPGIQYLAIHAAMHRFAPAKRIAMLIHSTSSLKRRIPLGSLRLASLADHLLCLSDQSRTELETRYGVPPARISVVGSRVDTEFFKPDPNAVAKDQVCSAGAINRDYGTLIEAVRPLGVPLKIAADTAWRYSAGKMEPAQTPPFVEMRSWGTYVNLRALYAESALVVVPLEKPMVSGITVALEGMAMGKAVIMTRNPYVEGFLRDEETGYFVPAGDAEALRAKIKRLLQKPDEAARIGARAREWVLERFTVARYVERIMSVWK